MLGRQMFQVVGAIVVHHNFPKLPLPEQLFALAGGREIGERGFAQLQPTPVEPIRAVDIDGAAHVIDVVQYKRSAVEDHWSGGPLDRETLGQVAGSDNTSLT